MCIVLIIQHKEDTLKNVADFFANKYLVSINVVAVMVYAFGSMTVWYQTPTWFNAIMGVLTLFVVVSNEWRTFVK